jgi:hypothetical protein
MIEDGFLPEAFEEAGARMDDAYWLRVSQRPLTPQRFLDWWVARRWVVPRDVRRH